MAHFAKLGINGKVIQVVPFDDDRMLNADGIEDEEVGRQALEQETGWPLWKQTSYNTRNGVHSGGKTPFRATSAGIGMIYNEQYDIFHYERPEGFDSWTLNTTTGKYEAPTPSPAYSDSTYVVDGETRKYTQLWNESTQKWEGFNDDGTVKLAIWNGSSWDSV